MIYQKKFYKYQKNGIIYFTGDDGNQFFLIFAPMLNSLTLDNNKKVTNWILTRVSLEKSKLFDPILAPIMSNLANGRISFKFSNFVLV